METPKLYRAFIEVTANCNTGIHSGLSPCTYCRNSDNELDNISYRIKEDPRIKAIKGWINDVAEAGAREIVLTGGEPLLRNDLAEIVGYSDNLALHTLIATNGLEINRELLDRIKRYDVKLQVSLDSIDEKINEQLRDGLYKPALNAIGLIKEYNMPLQISTTMASVNIDSIPDLINHFQDTDIKLRRLVEEGLAANRQDLIVPENKLVNIIKEFVLSKDHGANVGVEQAPYVADCGGQPYLYSCSAGTSIVFIRYNGDIEPCPSVNEVVGNIKKTPFKTIWEENFSNYRAGNKKPFGHCGRTDLINPMNLKIPGHTASEEDSMKNKCKCTG
ncbi:radical SAM protein [Candidatus Woesearchaeota archaeon]|nr:radical SAM protein [Candidatus Woesearchaeota archaeon]